MSRPTFSLRTLLVAVAVCGVVFAEFFAVPAWLATILGGFLNLALPAVLAVGIVFGRNHCRAFCIGAIIPAVCTCLSACENMLPMWTSINKWGSLNNLMKGGLPQCALPQQILLGLALSHGTLIG